MLIFVAPVRSPANSRSYARVGTLLAATLASVCRQTDTHFGVVVVCNERPPGVPDRPQVEFVEVGFPPPGTGRGSSVGYAEHVHDKATKYSVGVSVARELGATHVMPIDADDYLHHRLAALVASDPTRPGWFAEQGYVHTAGTRYVHLIPDGFYRKNGSSSVVRLDLIGAPDVARSATIDEVTAAVPTAVLRVLGEHGKWAAHLDEQGHSMEPLPFPCAVWEIGTGENHTGNLVSAREREPLTASITDTFGLARPSAPTAALTAVATQVRRVARRLRRS